MIGLSDEQLNVVKDIISKYENYEFFAYGSRVKGNFGKSSDLDILIKANEDVPAQIIDDINNAFYRSKLPFIVNVQQYANLNEKFYESIKKDLVLLSS